MIYEDLLNDFKSYISLEKGLSKNTELSYLRDVRHYLDYCEKNKINFATISAQDFSEYLIYLKGKGLKNSSLFRKTEAVKAFYRFLFVEKKIDKNPLSEFSAPKLERKLPQYLSMDEIKKIYDLFSASDFQTIRTCAVIDLLYSSGLRISEVCDLNMDCVDLNQGWIRVKGKGSKERIVPVSQSTMRILNIYLEERNLILGRKKITSPYFFVNKSGNRISRVQLWKDIKKFIKKTGIDKNVYPHIFRHTFATHLLHGGADLRSIGEMLGHSSLNTTQIYTHLDKSVIKDIHRKYHPKG